MNARSVFYLLVGVTVVAALGYTVPAADDDDDREKETRVSLAKVPDAVKATMLTQILKEFEDLELEGVVRELEDGVEVYEAEFELNDKEVELEISASGKLLEKEVAIDDDDDDDDDDDGDDEGDHRDDDDDDRHNDDDND